MGDSPTYGCSQCTGIGGGGNAFGAWGSSYRVYAPPPGHPVYTAPLKNTSSGNQFATGQYANGSYSILGTWDPLQRSSQIGLPRDFSTKNWSHPETAIVQMFHTL